MVLDRIDKDLFEKNHDLFKKHIGARSSRILLTKALTDRKNLTPRRMLNSIQRLVTLAEDMDKVRPGRKDLSIFFLITCIEAVYTLANSPLKSNKQELVIDFFTRFLTQDERDYLFSRLTILSDRDTSVFINPVNAEMFALLLIGVRNNIAHEGNYWSLHFKDRENSPDNICVIKAKIKKDEGPRELSYQVGFTYQRLKDICVKGLIKFAENYYEEVESDSEI